MRTGLTDPSANYDFDWGPPANVNLVALLCLATLVGVAAVFSYLCACPLPYGGWDALAM